MEEFAKLFFDHWYCDNGLPLKIVSDRDRQFTLKSWHAMHKMGSIKLGLGPAFHPQQTARVSDLTKLSFKRYATTSNMLRLDGYKHYRAFGSQSSIPSMPQQAIAGSNCAMATRHDSIHNTARNQVRKTNSRILYWNAWSATAVARATR